MSFRRMYRRIANPYVLCFIGLFAMPHVAIAIPENSILFDTQLKRDWFDRKGKKIKASLAAISRSFDKVYLKTGSALVPLEINVDHISKEDIRYIKNLLARNKYLFYNGEYHKVFGYLNDDYICIDDAEDRRLIIAGGDLDGEWLEVLRIQVRKGLYSTSSYDTEVVEKAREYLKGQDKNTDIAEVIGMSEGGVIAYRVTHFGDKINGSGFDYKSKVFVKYDNSVSCKVGDKVPQHRHWFVGFCHRTLNGERDKYACYVPRIEEALMLSVGYVEKHRAEPLFMQDGSFSDKFTEIGDINHRVAIITSKQGQGSGFIMRDGFKTWLYTNEHVARMGRDLNVVALDGVEYPVAPMVQIATNRDLFRYEIYSESYFQSPIIKKPIIGDKVIVYGNSDGGGVSTKLYGKILGVGPTRIEVDAPFVKGNSGGPIVSIDESIVGVATMAELHKDPSDFTKVGTRFNQTRRYGERVENVDWDVVSWECYSVSAEKLEAFEYLWEILSEACFKRTLMKEFDANRVKQIGNYRIENAMRKLCDADNAMVKFLREEKSSGNEYFRKWHYDRFEECETECFKCRQKVLETTTSSFKGRAWATLRLEERANQLSGIFNLAVKKFRDMYNDKLEERKVLIRELGGFNRR